MGTEPTTLQEAIIYFANPTNCPEYLVARRWPNGVTCPRCGSTNALFLKKYNRWHCREKHAAPQFTLKTGTIMEDSPIGLDKWMMAVWQIVNCKNGISSYEVHRAIGITQKSAWFLDHRIRFALHQGSFDNMMAGEVEADETFIGGKSRNMHKDVRARKITGTGGKDKAIVLGILERSKDGKQSRVRTKVVANRKKHALQSEVRKHVEVDHAVQYVDGKIHTNGLENFWSLLKRGIKWHVCFGRALHLFRYLDEQAYRYNNRKDDAGIR